MAQYLLIESHDPFERNDVLQHYELAENLVKEGNEVTLFLVQNGVLPVRQGNPATALAQLAAAGVEVLADDFSLRERGITPDRMIAEVSAAPLERVIDQLAEGRKALWH